jgi:hypothetical protein
MELLLGDKDADARKVRIHDIRDKEEDYSRKERVSGFEALCPKGYFQRRGNHQVLIISSNGRAPQKMVRTPKRPVLTPMRG